MAEFQSALSEKRVTTDEGDSGEGGALSEKVKKIYATAHMRNKVKTADVLPQNS